VAEEDHAHAGQGAVVLDIGGDVGALVVRMPPSLAGAEIEARPVGVGSSAACPSNPTHLEHVAVLARPLPDGGEVHCAVFAALPAGTYELYVRPAGPVRLSVQVTGGAVADAIWP
jgi:hypothetical protein